MASPGLSALLRAAEAGRRAEPTDALALLIDAPIAELMPVAESLTLAGFGETVTYSRKVFIPLTQLCRDVCHYCTFAKAPRHLKGAYLSSEEVLAVALAGKAADCKEALFTLGDKPELRYAAARRALDAAGAATTLEYLERMAKLVLEQSGLLPHLNPGVMTAADLAKLRPVSASMGLMLESASERLCARGGPHFGSPDKAPAARLATLRAAGELAIPMTTGLLIGIGETRRERLEALLALREIADAHGHIQELIIQNFKAKAGTKMAEAPEPTLEEQLWTVAAARLLFGPSMSIQAPPNLQPAELDSLIRAGINDWGGVSPVTPDHVNPEAPWPHLADLARDTAAAGRDLVERLALVPRYAVQAERWTDPAITSRVRRQSDSRGFARPDRWFAGSGSALPPVAARWARVVNGNGQRTSDTVLTDAERPNALRANHAATNNRNNGPLADVGRPDALRSEATSSHRRSQHGIGAIINAALAGDALNEADIVRLFSVEGRALDEVIAAADQLRQESVGDTVTYVVNRNINYTNICLYHCGFCAFSKAGARRICAARPTISIWRKWHGAR